MRSEAERKLRAGFQACWRKRETAQRQGSISYPIGL